MEKIPSHAKCVFQGIIFDVYQREQEMFDGSKETFEVISKNPTAGVIALTTEWKILLVKEIQPRMQKWTIGLPTGRIERNEDPLLAAKRELLEETGYAGDFEELEIDNFPNKKIDWKFHIYLATNCEKIASQNLDAGEKIEIIECNEEELEKIMQDPLFDKESKKKIEKWRHKITIS